MQPLPAPSPGARNSHSTSILTRGRTAYRERRYAEAARWFRVASREEPSDPWTWIWLARTLKQLDDRDGSYASIRRALGIAPDSASARLHLIDLLLEEGRNDLAGEALKDLAGGSGREEWVARAVARRLARLPDPHAVLSQLPPTARLRGAREEAERHLCVADPAMAWRLLRSTALQAPDRPLLLRIARGLRRAGELTLALEVLDRAAAIDPPSPRILHIRDHLRAEVRVTSGSWSPRASERQDLELHPGRLLVLSEGTEGSDGSWGRGIARLLLPSTPDKEHPLDQWLELRLAEIVELALRVRPSAILAARGRWTGLLAMHARKLLGTSMIYEAGAAPAPYASSQACRWRRDQEQRLLEAADLILVRTVAARDRYLQAGIGRGRIAVVPAREAYGAPPASGRATWPSRFMASSSWASVT